MSADPLLSVRGLTKYFDEDDSLLDRLLNIQTPPVRAVDDVSFDVERGQTLGLVGESGCGKTTAGLTIAGLLEPTAGATYFEGRNIYEIGGRELNEFRRNIQIVFQDPFSSLNPRMTVGEVVREPLNIHGVGSRAERRRRVEELLEHVGLSADQIDRYPHEFSGGQRQRICIARALALEPDFVLLDEPVSSLDVSVQAQILNLLNDLQAEFDLTYLFIAHDLGVVQYLCDRVAVMYLGKIVEIGPTAAIFEEPRHPYTRALLDSIPRPNLAEQQREVAGLTGDVPSPRQPPRGCSFHTRCQQIIRPPGLDVDGEVFRAVAALRHRLETDPDGFEEYAVADPEEATDGSVARRAEELRVAFDIATDLSDPAAERAVAEAVGRIVRGEYGAASAPLREVFATICRLHEPELEPTASDGHCSACFLSYEEPPELPEVPPVEPD